MRLIDCEIDGVFTLTADLGRDRIPEYAILSHTWGPDEDEVKYDHLINGDGRGRRGWEKIRFCSDRARRDGLRYIWVDSCCIDKTSSAELTEAINSMFSWYKRAARCHVYLAEVSATDPQKSGLSSEAWMPAFRSSKWFTRSWTLQELLAPSAVEFFSQEGNLLGTRESLLQQIHEITGISVRALSGDDLAGFSVLERFDWAEHRQATREEDCGYSLMGIFGVYIVLIYGESKENATWRLKREIGLLSQKTSKSDLERVTMLLDKSKVRAEDSKARLLEIIRVSEDNDARFADVRSSFLTFLTMMLARAMAMFTSLVVIVGMLDEQLDLRVSAGEKVMLSSQSIKTELREEEESIKSMMKELDRARDHLQSEGGRDDAGLSGAHDGINRARMEAEHNRLQNERQDMIQDLEELRSTREQEAAHLLRLQGAHEKLKTCLSKLKARRSEEERKLSKLREEQEEIKRRRDESENMTAWEKIKSWILWPFSWGS